MKFNKIMTAIVTTGCMFSGAAAFAASALNAAQTKQVQAIVQDYINQNPETIIQSLQSFQQKEMSKSVEKTQTTSLSHVDAIFRQPGDPMAGNPKGKVTVVEFFDYQCGHCVSMQKVMQDLVKNNSEVRVVFKEFPIRGPASEVAARVALAAELQGKYVPFHDALMQMAAKGPLTEEIVYATAGSVGLDVNKLKEAVKSEAVNQQISNNFALAQQLGLMGTPAIFVASSSVNSKSPATDVVFIPGETDMDHLNEVIKQVSK